MGPNAGFAPVHEVPQEPTKNGSRPDLRELLTAFGLPGLEAYVGLLHTRVGGSGLFPLYRAQKTKLSSSLVLQVPRVAT